MNRSIVRTLAAVAALVLFAVPAAAQEGATAPPANTRFVFVNTSELLPRVPGAENAQQTFNEDVEGYQEEMQALQAEVDSLLAAYREEQEGLTGPQREQRQREIIEKQQQLAARRAQLEQQAQQRQQELLRPILDRVSQVIEEIRTENNYAIVFDVSAAGVVSADPSLDITELVLQRLQSGAGDTARATPGR